MPSYLSINHRLYQHNVKYLSANNYLPQLVPLPPIHIVCKLDLQGFSSFWFLKELCLTG